MNCRGSDGLGPDNNFLFLEINWNRHKILTEKPFESCCLVVFTWRLHLSTEMKIRQFPAIVNLESRAEQQALTSSSQAFYTLYESRLQHQKRLDRQHMKHDRAWSCLRSIRDVTKETPVTLYLSYRLYRTCWTSVILHTIYSTYTNSVDFSV